MMKSTIDYKDFLCDDLFIYWRIHPTKELDSFWSNYLNENEEVRESFKKAIEDFELIRSRQNAFQFNEASILQKMNIGIKRRRREKSVKLLTMSAAAVLLFLIVSTLFLPHRKPEYVEPQGASTGKVIDNNNVRFHAGSSILEIDNNSTLDLSEKKQSALIQNPLSQREIDLSDNQTNRLIVPYGKRSTLILADGSKVHLNSGTTMEFPTTFSEKKREIHVEGEIFIEVVKRNNSPFVIHTTHSQITVHGTSFNVSSYTEDKSEAVVLVDGSVEVKSHNSAVVLQPDEMAEIENGRITRKQVDVSDYTGWTKGYIQLNKTPLNEVLKKIGRYYNVSFNYNPDLNIYDQTCSGKLFLSDDLNDILDAFSKMTYLQYDKRDNETIFIRQ